LPSERPWIRSRPRSSSVAPSGYGDLHRADLLDRTFHHVAGMHLGDALASAGHDDVAGPEGVEFRGPGDLLSHAQDHVAGVRGLAHHAADRHREIKVAEIPQLLGADHPWSEHGVAVERCETA